MRVGASLDCVSFSVFSCYCAPCCVLRLSLWFALAEVELRHERRARKVSPRNMQMHTRENAVAYLTLGMSIVASGLLPWC